MGYIFGCRLCRCLVGSSARLALLRCVPSRWELRLICRLGTCVRVPPARVISRVGSCPAVGAPARLSPVQVSCGLGGGSPAQLSPRSCVVWPWRWELCSIVASLVSCGLGGEALLNCRLGRCVVLGLGGGSSAQLSPWSILW